MPVLLKNTVYGVHRHEPASVRESQFRPNPPSIAAEPPTPSQGNPKPEPEIVKAAPTKASQKAHSQPSPIKRSAKNKK